MWLNRIIWYISWMTKKKKKTNIYKTDTEKRIAIKKN